MGTPSGNVATVDNAGSRRLILGIAIVSGLIYLGLSRAGELRDSLPTLFTGHAALVLLLFAAWRTVRPGLRYRGIVLGGAVVFRLIAAVGPPALSDDVHRYVWDGRVQLHGNSPYRYAPDDPALAELRDESWAAINHPELKTIYPPLTQLFFVMLAAVGAGPVGFKLAMAALDIVVVLALSRLLRRCRLPADRLILYAWNPLAILETAGSGHVEPLGVAPIVLAAAWIIDRRDGLSTTALGAAVHAKLLPIVLVPAYVRRLGWRGWLPLILLVALLVPFVAANPSDDGGGLATYAERWERNAVAFSLLREGLESIDAGNVLKRAVAFLQGRLELTWFPWNFLYRHLWPPYVARLLVGLAALVWILHLARNRDRPIVRESLLVLGGVLLLSPTLHPWYLLWLLPFAAAALSWPWLLFAALAPLAYSSSGEVPWVVRAAEYLPPLALAIWIGARRRSRRLKDR